MKRKNKAKATLRIDKKRRTLKARMGGQSCEAPLVDGLVGRLADSLRNGTGLRWGEVRVLAPAAGGDIEVTVGGEDGVTVPLSAEAARELACRIDPPPENPDEPYIRFRETNNWEKERWRFYIPLRGNELAIRELSDALRRLKPVNGCFVGSHVPYDIRMIPTPEADVDRVCRRCRCQGYMASCNKLEGRLDIRAVRRAVRLLIKDARLLVEKPIAYRFVEDDLYKGGIAKMMRPWRRRPTTTDWPTGHIRAALCRTPIHISGYSARPKRDWGDRLPKDIHGGVFRRQSWGDRCWDARARLSEAGFKTIGDIAALTERKLLATSGIGRETVNLTRWMLEEVGLRLS